MTLDSTDALIAEAACALMRTVDWADRFATEDYREAVGHVLDYLAAFGCEYEGPNLEAIEAAVKERIEEAPE